ncbi:MAG: beta-ketoacyl synthase chain length factor [Bacteroidales bacterium]|nr:beta-ketoacyl synthase chain length factor [Bacteroidales bacterium]
MLFIPHKHLYISCTSYVSADEPDYKEVITDANSRRRMGRLLKMAVWCGLKSLDGVPSERVAGIITSTGAGFMKDTISFGSSIFDREETLLNPSPFMQSTFNTASGYIALIRKIHAYNTTYVQQADGFAASLVDAAMLLDDAGEGNVALVGAFDEVTPEVDVIRQRLGLYRVGDGFLPLGEGAAAFLLSAAMPTDVSESCPATEMSTGPGGGDGSESDSERDGDESGSEFASWPCDESGSESASEHGDESGSESSSEPLRESESASEHGDESSSESSSETLHEFESASRPCDESGSESASEHGGDANSECSTGPLCESKSASRPCDESGSESASERGGDANSECSTGPLHESVSASCPCDEFGSESASERGGDANSECSTGHLHESESASWPCDEFGSESSSEPLHEYGGTSSRSLNGTKDGNAALRFCGLANLSDLPKSAENPFAELFGINACVNVISCADHVESLGAFRSLLPVLLCKLISEQLIPDGYTAIVDDVNEDGVIVLLHK